MMYERYAKCGSTILNPWGMDDPTGPSVYANSKEYTSDGKNPPSLENPFLKFQSSPTAAACNPYTAQTLHPSHINMVMCDASVKNVAPSVSATSWHATITPKLSGGAVGRRVDIPTCGVYQFNEAGELVSERIYMDTGLWLAKPVFSPDAKPQ